MAEWKIYYANNGKCYEILERTKSISIHDLRIEISKLVPIDEEDQILLYGPPFNRLDPRKFLFEYDIQENMMIYLYNRSTLSEDSSYPEPFRLVPKELIAPSASVLSSSKLLNSFSSPLIRALSDYEQQFLVQFEKGDGLYAAIEEDLGRCSNCMKEEMVQEEAVRAAILNLQNYQSSISKRFNAFFEGFNKDHEGQKQMLLDFQGDIDTLSTIKMHPILVTEDRKVLLDCIPLDREKQWFLECEQSHEHLYKKVIQLEEEHNGILNSVGQELKVTLLEDKQDLVHKMESLMKEHKQLAKQVTILESNHQSVVRRVQEITNACTPSSGSGSIMSDSTNALEACRGLDELWNDQIGIVPCIENLHKQMVEFMQSLSSSKSKVSNLVFDHLRVVSNLQSQIRDMATTLDVLKDAVEAQGEHFMELQHLQKLPDAYIACLSEIVRRRKYGKVFTQKIQAMGEELGALRENEMEHREEFLRTFGQHLPRDFVPGLAEKPSHCEFRMRPFDQNLPIIDDESLLTEAHRSAANFLMNTAKPEVDIVERQNGDHEELCAEILTLRQQVNKLNSQNHALATQINSGSGEHRGVPVLMAFAAAADVADETSSTDAMSPAESIEKFSTDITNESRSMKIAELESQLACVHQTSEIKNEKLRSLEDEIKSLKIQAETQQATMNSLLNEGELTANLIKKSDSNHEELVLDLKKQIATLEENNHEVMVQIDEARFAQAQVETSLRSSLHDAKSSLADKEILFQECNKQQHKIVKDLLCLLSEKARAHIKPKVLPATELYPDATLHVLVDSIQSALANNISERQSQSDYSNVAVEDNGEKSQLMERIQHLELENITLRGSKLAFQSFDVNDIALFFPTTPNKESTKYTAFHIGCPNHFLSEESVTPFLGPDNSSPDFIVGKILFVDREVASQGNNPYHLKVGTPFYMILVTRITEE